MPEQYKTSPNPDDRSDNVEKLQEAIYNTIENMNEAREAAEFSNEKDRAAIEAKNERRMESIEGMRKEIKEEAAYRNE
ncbi:small acid-soluble spore protein (thioredoxin-like protein) [Bacillus sp. 491mf]|uniref:small acid-soluble spore protein Tlp n=1 Tax=Bacillus sp. 491mf TaxID=1761755 RepID=UPI0008F40D0F|nr:small acid-soluble spore protein Tlp [Bacillus sp. 491mf]SFC88630.1 small acid-soluble spore protein (thioredoxin-like protein) [Bacillus sp. 491mf]